jgi:ribosome-binding factor A
MVQELLGELFARGMRDPRIGLVTITGVKMSPDLREARVYWTVHGDPEQRKHTAKGLDKARGFLRREIGLQLKLRVTPDLHFSYDEAIDRGERIEQLIRSVHEEDRNRAAEPAPEHDE